MKTRVLILCTANSCRSQMAEGVLRYYGGDHFDVQSAGTKPSKINETAIQVMREIGIDISGQRAKSLDEFLGQHFHYVITVCDHANESCPVFPGNSIRLHWGFQDPPHDIEISPEVLNEFRKIRDLIHQKFRRAAITQKFE